MHENITHIETIPPRTIVTSFPHEATEYSEILDYFGVVYKLNDYYYQAGEIPWVQGWILHISVIMSQFKELIQILIPILTGKNIAFKIAKDKDTVRNLLDGRLGLNHLGKVIIVYPDTTVNIQNLSKLLVEISKPFQGPNIPTDINLGGCVYTRYGGGNSVLLLDASGKSQKHIYNHKGSLIPDPYLIPFKLPKGINWPFVDILKFKVQTKSKILKKTYKLLSKLKSDARGDVWKALYLKGFLKTSPCVIKEGKKNMCSDENGRDIGDRLIWQHKLHKELEGLIPLPKVIDFFNDQGNAYLVMEFIDGIPLFEFMQLLNSNRQCWIDLSLNKQSLILEILLKIITIIETFHKNGYVHRDITPVNFLITDKNEIFLIDIELAYSMKSKIPLPPFSLGTPGFMSPQQSSINLPTVEEDIYGLSATMLNIFTGIVPIKFTNSADKTTTENKLFFLLKDRPLSKLIANGIQSDPTNRPDLNLIRSTIEEYRESLLTNHSLKHNNDTLLKIENKGLENTIQRGISSIATSPILTWEGIWLSKSIQNDQSIHQQEYCVNPGLYDGIAGILYFLGRAKFYGFSIEECMNNYRNSWSFLNTNYLSILKSLPQGLFGGTAGIAMALSSGLKSGLLKDSIENRILLEKCLELKTDCLDLATGVSGQIVAIINCQEYLPPEVTHKLLTSLVQILLDNQKRDGSWSLIKNNRAEQHLSLNYGIPGIIWSLLEYNRIYPNEAVKNASVKALNYINKKTDHLANVYTRQKLLENSPIQGNNELGVILTFIKAYESLKDISYKKAVEDILNQDPINIVNNDFTQSSGLAGFGEMYIEAWRVFENVQWKKRAEWLVDLFITVSISNSHSSCYWIMDQEINPTADIMRGNSGILHFLLRYKSQGKLGHCLLS